MFHDQSAFASWVKKNQIYLNRHIEKIKKKKMNRSTDCIVENESKRGCFTDRGKVNSKYGIEDSMYNVLHYELQNTAEDEFSWNESERDDKRKSNKDDIEIYYNNE